MPLCLEQCPLFIFALRETNRNSRCKQRSRRCIQKKIYRTTLSNSQKENRYQIGAYYYYPLLTFSVLDDLLDPSKQMGPRYEQSFDTSQEGLNVLSIGNADDSFMLIDGFLTELRRIVLLVTRPGVT
jgi:hypothetical protein